MAAEYCPEHAQITDHLRESSSVRDTITKNATKLTNYDVWIPKIEAKVDAIPSMLNSFFLKILLSIGFINLVSVVAIKLTVK